MLAMDLGRPALALVETLASMAAGKIETIDRAPRKVGEIRRADFAPVARAARRRRVPAGKVSSARSYVA
jgi:hypothetical protein